ncbi:hypothetical protein [Chondromyces apiculatus]|uniref:Cell wall/surface repeat protein n=1 Tax=Chondromyces apiculatus DSM 436 TaxID=1192034 RepID=A0A017SVI1_9BACT|nr:hypothetical protein [Chondromyces apiculatus]EYF00585.1 cell wall/surface repeat protein [Chondromyces apiculatus DSM 436]
MIQRTIVSMSAVGLTILACACGGDGDDGEGGGSNTGGGGGSSSSGTTGTTGTTTGNGTGDVCNVAARNLPISDAPGSQPSLVWAGDRYALAWTDRANAEGNIHLALVGSDGAVQKHIEITTGPEDSSHPTVTAAGDGLLVLWQDTEGTGSIVRAQRVGMDGTLMGNVLNLGQSTAAESWPVSATTGSGAAIAWMDQTSSRLTFTDATGSVSSAVTLPGARFPGLTTDGAQIGIGWSEGSKVGFGRPDTNGVMTPVHHDGVTAAATRVALGDDASYLIWEDSRGGSGSEQIYAARIASDGALGEEVIVPSIGGSANWPSAVWTGSHLAVTYYQFRDGPSSVFLELFADDLTPSRIDLVVSGDAAARFPSLAWNSTTQELAVAYAEREGNIYLSTITCP